MKEAHDIWYPVLVPGFCRCCGLQMGAGCVLAFFELIMGIWFTHSSPYLIVTLLSGLLPSMTTWRSGHYILMPVPFVQADSNAWWSHKVSLWENDQWLQDFRTSRNCKENWIYCIWWVTWQLICTKDAMGYGEIMCSTCGKHAQNKNTLSSNLSRRHRKQDRISMEYLSWPFNI